MGRKIPIETARKVYDLRHEITRLSLDVVGHDELWGCLRAAGAAMEECQKIAHRDVEQVPPLQQPAAVRKADRRRSAGSPARGARAKGLVK